MKYYITGDIHGSIERIKIFRQTLSVEEAKDTALIILGDCGFNYYLDIKDMILKEKARKLDIILFCVKGNHELHPDQIASYKIKEWNGAPVYYEDEFPNILFAKDGEVYTIAGKKIFVMGGAYSVDKEHRLMQGLQWFDTEQPSQETKMYGLKTLNKNDWNVDIVLSHAAPLKTEPVHMFLPFIDQKSLDKSTEKFLDEISDKLTFDKWYFGHYHGEWVNGKYEMLYKNIKLLLED